MKSEKMTVSCIVVSIFTYEYNILVFKLDFSHP